MLVTYLIKRIEVVRMNYASAKYCGFVCFGYEVTSRFSVGMCVLYFYAYIQIHIPIYAFTTTNLKQYVATFTNKIIKHIIIIERRHKMYK